MPEAHRDLPCIAGSNTVESSLGWRRALQRLEGAYAPKTLHGYAADLAIFERWCDRSSIAPFPATAGELARFVDAQMVGCAPRTVMRRLAAIRRIHSLLGLRDESRDEPVLLALRRGLMLRRRPPRQALGLSATLRDELLNGCPKSLKGLRDRALIAVGYDTMCRRSELSALQLADVERLPTGGAKVLIRRAKNDPFGEGAFAYVSTSGVAHLQAWVSAAKIISGPLFRPTFKTAVGEESIHPRTINRVLQSAAIQAGCKPSTVARLSAHSLRVGPAQDLAIAGRSVLQIMCAGRWRHADAVSRYVRAADVNIWT